MEFIDIVWREPVSVLTADFIGKFSGWNYLSKFYNVLSSLGAKSSIHFFRKDLILFRIAHQSS